MTRAARWRRSATAQLALLVVAAGAQATPAERFGFGARSAALAAADSAETDDHAAVYQDPALLGVPSSSSFGAGFQAFDYALDQASPKSIALVHAGFVARGKLLSLPVGVGLSLALPQGKLSTIETLSAERPAWVIDALSNRVAFVGVGLGFELVEGLALGATLGHLAAVEGSFNVEGSVAASLPQATPFGSSLSHSVDAELSSVRYATFAARFSPSRSLALALVYRDAATIEQRITGVLDGTLTYGGVLAVPVTYRFQSQSISAHLPRKLTLALYLEPSEALGLHASLSWIDWSAAQSPEARTSSRTHAEPPPGLELDLPPDRAAPRAGSAGFRDRFVPRLALEHRFELTEASRVAGRVGLAHEPSPVSSQAPWFDASRTSVSVGSGLKKALMPWGELELDVYALLSFFGERGHATGAGLSLGWRAR